MTDELGLRYANIFWRRHFRSLVTASNQSAYCNDQSNARLAVTCENKAVSPRDNVLYLTTRDERHLTTVALE